MPIDLEQLTAGQRAARQTVLTMAAGPRTGIPDTCVIRGPAGTGKTTLLKSIVDEVGPSFIVAPTGKAASRVKEATGYSASTIHRLLFKVYKCPITGEAKFAMKDPEEIGRPESGLLFADESSMIDRWLYEQLLCLADAVGLKLVFVGDLAQLPPVTSPGEEPFNLLDPKLFEPTYSADLTEIVRQAAGDPLIQTLTMFRSGKALDALKRLKGIHQEELVTEAVRVIKAGGAIITHTNALRHKLNRAIRSRLGFPEGILVAGEPLSVTRNNYTAGVFNGDIVTFKEWTLKPIGPYGIENRFLVPAVRQDVFYGRGTVDIEGVKQKVVLCNEEIFGELTPGLTATTVNFGAKVHRWVRKYRDDESIPADPMLNANLGFCLTCHRSQGSEWPEVLVVPDKVNISTADGRRWYYTAFSRSKKKVQICMYDEKSPI